VAYGGRWDITQAARRLAIEVQGGERDPAAIDEADLASHLELNGLPDPDLFIRTGGERRISNFLLWNLAYTELWFSDCLWPDFDDREYDAALEFFAGRERRYGQTSAQVRGA
jgi:undecaprenyl diphosphate synthase